MATEWTTRAVEAPADDLLSLSDVARLFGVSTTTLDKLIAEGQFPGPLRMGKQLLVWDWRAVTYYRLRLEMAGRLVAKAAKAAPADDGDE